MKKNPFKPTHIDIIEETKKLNPDFEYVEIEIINSKSKRIAIMLDRQGNEVKKDLK
jgi:hypothetical protein